MLTKLCNNFLVKDRSQAEAYIEQKLLYESSSIVASYYISILTHQGLLLIKDYGFRCVGWLGYAGCAK